MSTDNEDEVDPGWEFASVPARKFLPGAWFSTTAEYLRPPARIPIVHVTPLAIAKIQALVGAINLEVGWLGTARRINDDRDILVEDIFLFKQDVSGGHTEISTDTFQEFITEILKRPDGEDIFNNTRFWGHSHGMGGVYPSGQDNDQMRVFEEFGAGFFLRGIFNRKGDIGFSVFDWDAGIAYHHVPWEIQGQSLSRLRRDQIVADMEAEMLSKVRAKRHHFRPKLPAATVILAPVAPPRSFGFWPIPPFKKRKGD